MTIILLFLSLFSFQGQNHKNIKIEVYLGSDDKIIDSQKALEFFKNCGCEVYYIKIRVNLGFPK